MGYWLGSPCLTLKLAKLDLGAQASSHQKLGLEGCRELGRPARLGGASTGTRHPRTTTALCARPAHRCCPPTSASTSALSRSKARQQWSKCPLGSAPARLLCLLRARLAAPDSLALRCRGHSKAADSAIFDHSGPTATVLDGMGSEKERLVSVDELKNRFFILGLQTGFALQMFVMAVRAFACSTQPSCCTHARPLCPLCRLHSVTTPSPRLSPVLQHDLASLLCIGRHDGDDLPHGRCHRGA